MKNLYFSANINLPSMFYQPNVNVSSNSTKCNFSVNKKINTTSQNSHNINTLLASYEVVYILLMLMNNWCWVFFTTTTRTTSIGISYGLCYVDVEESLMLGICDISRVDLRMILCWCWWIIDVFLTSITTGTSQELIQVWFRVEGDESLMLDTCDSYSQNYKSRIDKRLMLHWCWRTLDVGLRMINH